MRRFLFLSLVVVCSSHLFAQITTIPAFITKGYSDTILINFNPNEGNKGMSTATACYAHVGLITGDSKSDSDWKYAPTWRGGDAKYKMTKVDDVWQLVIPNIYTFFNCPTTTEIRRMAFVFNDGPNGSLEGKTADGADIFVDLVDSGLFVLMQPAGNQMVYIDRSVTFAGYASENAQLSLSVDGNVVKDGVVGTELTYEYVFTQSGVYNITFSAANSDTIVSTTSVVTVIREVTDSVRPTDLQTGITYLDSTTVALCLYAGSKTEPAQNVFIIGDFNNWQALPEYQMYRDGFYFWKIIDGLTPGKEYAMQYKVIRADGKIKHLSDPYSTKLLHPDDRYEPKTVDPTLMDYPSNSEADGGYVTVINTKPEQFKWSAQTLNFVKPDKNNLVIYELWIYDYTPTRNIAGLMEMLDYLHDLGVNAIELMPICEFDGNYNWGYSPNHYFAPDKAYGSERDYKELIDECHKRGMAVILDMVFNHATGLNPQNKLYPYGSELAFNPYSNLHTHYLNAVH